jgi:hypothetical protein
MSGIDPFRPSGGKSPTANPPGPAAPVARVSLAESQPQPRCQALPPRHTPPCSRHRIVRHPGNHHRYGALAGAEIDQRRCRPLQDLGGRAYLGATSIDARAQRALHRQVSYPPTLRSAADGTGDSPPAGMAADLPQTCRRPAPPGTPTPPVQYVRGESATDLRQLAVRAVTGSPPRCIAVHSRSAYSATYRRSRSRLGPVGDRAQTHRRSECTGDGPARSRCP